jgi:hypothetical protein
MLWKCDSGLLIFPFKLAEQRPSAGVRLDLAILDLVDSLSADANDSAQSLLR